GQDAGVKAFLEGLLGTELGRITETQAMKLRLLGSREVGEVGVDVTKMVTLLIAVAVSVGKGRAREDRPGTLLAQMCLLRLRLRHAQSEQTNRKQPESTHSGSEEKNVLESEMAETSARMSAVVAPASAH